MKKWEKALYYIELLPNNWDSYGAKSIDKETINLVRTILTVTPEKSIPEIHPNHDGSISLFYEDREIRVKDGHLLKI